MEYYKKYLKYRRKYVIKQIAGRSEKLIFISGIPGSGKSTVAEEFGRQGYYIISTDKVIDEKIVPLFSKEIKEEFNNKKAVIFGIYHPKDYGPIIKKARKNFIKIVKKMIKKRQKKGDKIVVEGTILNKKVLRGIFGRNENFKFYFIKPKNKEEYKQRFIKRFEEDPENYGRLGRLRKLDKDGKALEDYRNNGIKGKIISELIKKVIKMKYDKMGEWIEYYTEWGLEINYLLN